MHKLLGFICDELDDLERKVEKDGHLSMAEVQYADVLAHTKKNLLKSEEMMDEDYSSYGGDNMPYRGVMYSDGRSYASGRGRNARRDAMGRYASRGYSRAGDMVDQLRTLMNDAPDDRTRQKIQNLVSEMEMM